MEERKNIHHGSTQTITVVTYITCILRHFAEFAYEFGGSNQDSYSYHQLGPQPGLQEGRTLLWAVHLVSRDDTADNMMGQSP